MHPVWRRHVSNRHRYDPVLQLPELQLWQLPDRHRTVHLPVLCCWQFRCVWANILYAVLSRVLSAVTRDVYVHHTMQHWQLRIRLWTERLHPLLSWFLPVHHWADFLPQWLQCWFLLQRWTVSVHHLRGRGLHDRYHLQLLCCWDIQLKGWDVFCICMCFMSTLIIQYQFGINIMYLLSRWNLPVCNWYDCMQYMLSWHIHDFNKCFYQ